MGNFRRDAKGYHYTIPEAFDPSLSYDMQYQRLRNLVLKIIDEMEINVPYLIMTKVTHTNDSITITGSLYQDYKFVSLNNTFSLVGLGDGTYYLNLNNRHKYAPCDKDIVSVPFEGTMYVSTQYMPKDELTLYSITKENGVVTEVKYNDIYTGMHNIAEDAHENRFSDVYSKIQTEIDRATSAEETLDKKIEDETDRAETSESALDDKIEAETQRAKSAETQLQNNITAETNRATAKENELSAAITAEQQRAEQAEQQITNAVNTEVQNRTAAVTEERERAIAAENAITENMTNLVNTEKDRAIAAETSITTNMTNLVNTEKDRAIAAETSITTNMTNLVNTEKDRAIAAETSITEDMTNLIETEKDRAIAAEENLQSQFNNWEAQLDGVEAKVDGKQDKIGAVQGNATDMEITGIPATNSIAFKSANGDILAVKTKVPTSPTDAVSKAYLDNEVELINNSLDEKQDKIGKVNIVSPSSIKVTEVPVSEDIGFLGTDGNLLNVKTGTPSANDDSTTKKYVDDTITSATKLNWKDATLIFYKNDGSEVSQKPIKYAEDNNFIYVSFNIGINNLSIQRAYCANLDIDMTVISNTINTNNLTYNIRDGVNYETFFANTMHISPRKDLDIRFTDSNNNIDFTGKGLSIYGTYLFKK